MKSCPECYSEYEDALEKCPSDSATLRKIDKDPLVGTRLADRYEVVSVVGRGGMGVVYKVRQEQMDRYMAVKMLHSHMVAEPEAVKRFYREAKTVSQVRHHHIITLYDFGMSKLGQPYLVMDYLEGTSLKNILKDEGPVEIERAERIFAQVCDALQSAHSVDLVHRDLKPENIMLSKNGGQDDWVTLVDFGLSKLRDPKANNEENFHITKIGDVCGSPPYMSPEQCLSSQAVDPRSDIYSLAICVYETLSAKLPFNAKSAIEMLDAHLYATPIPFNQILPDFKMCTEITHVLNKALQKDPERRHQTVQEFGTDFREACRRDAVKFRAMKTRAEISNFRDLQSEAEALASTGQLQELPPEAVSAIEAHQAKEKKVNGSWMSKITGAFRKKDEAVAEAEPIAEGKNGAETCTFCGAAITPGIKFCLNCQHKIAPSQAPATLRGGTGRRSGRGNDAVDMRNRTKASFNHMGLSPQVAFMALLIVIAVSSVLITVNYDLVKSRIEKAMGTSATKEEPTPPAKEASVPPPGKRPGKRRG